MDESEEGGPVSSFQSLAAEGDILYKQGDLKKAIEAYSKVPLLLDVLQYLLPLNSFL